MWNLNNNERIWEAWFQKLMTALPVEYGQRVTNFRLYNNPRKTWVSAI
jgi:hypothetical protein